MAKFGFGPQARINQLRVRLLRVGTLEIKNELDKLPAVQNPAIYPFPRAKAPYLEIMQRGLRWMN